MTEPLASSRLSRRHVLYGAAVAAGAVGLAACGTSGGTSAQPQGGSGGPGGSAGSGGSAGPAGQPVTKLSAVPVGGAVAAKAPDGAEVIVAQPAAGKVVGFSARCTHQGCIVLPQGKQLVCPCHGSVFDALTGKNLEGPAPRPLDTFLVTVAGGEVVTG